MLFVDLTLIIDPTLIKELLLGFLMLYECSLSELYFRFYFYLEVLCKIADFYSDKPSRYAGGLVADW